MVEAQSRTVPGSRTGNRECACAYAEDGVMRYAFVNPNWDFTGSTYFGCQDPHYPLELLFAYDQVREAGHEPLLLDAQVDKLNATETAQRVRDFNPDFVVI